MSTAVAVASQSSGELMERVITQGDLSGLTPKERTQYYMKTCESVGLNPLTMPLAYIKLNGKLVLYALRAASDQLRKIHGISIEVVSREIAGDLLTVHVRAKDKSGRTDEDFGVVSIAGLKGEVAANAALKCITKAKRRVTLSISGLGWLDESEVADIPAGAKAAAPIDPPPEDDGECLSPEQIEQLRNLIVEVGADIQRFAKYMKVATIDDIHPSQFDRAVAALEAKRTAS